MRSLPNPSFNTEVPELIQATLKQFIPAIWHQAFIAPMYIKGDYDQINVRSKTLPGLSIKMWKDHLECHFAGNAYLVSWEVGRPWHIVGGWQFSSNWRSGREVLPHLISALVDHSLKMAHHIVI